jgi:Fe-S cluster assembly ATP-binding protein
VVERKNVMRFFKWQCCNPKLAILDETDSGLDIDALRIVATGVNKLKSKDNATIVITHYQRLLDYIVPDFVHILIQRPHCKKRRKRIGPRVRSKRLR